MDFLTLIPFFVIFIIFYFLIFRPQAARQKAHMHMLTSIKPGQNVLLNNGIFGKISKVSEEEITVEIASDVKVRVVKSAVAKVIV